jgi:hypothetical protein
VRSELTPRASYAPKHTHLCTVLIHTNPNLHNAPTSSSYRPREKSSPIAFFSPQSIDAFATRLPAELPLTAPAENSHVNALNDPHSLRITHRFQRYNAM